MLYFATFKSKYGWIGLLSSDNGLVKSTFPQKSEEQAFLKLGSGSSHAIVSKQHFEKAIKFLDDYFCGKRIIFSGKLDLSNATAFQKLVWEETYHISYGSTSSYFRIAQNINNPRSCRAVGNALNKNPLPIIIPCHRVVKNDGKLGGFGGGLEMKRFLLELEKK
jgi:methylated-DNA-[protein]-cysteine S-methyltransferase